MVKDVKRAGLLLVTWVGSVSSKRHLYVGGKRDRKERDRRVTLPSILLEALVKTGEMCG